MSYRVIRDGVEIGVSPTIVHIDMGENGAYQECSPEEAEGFCVKLPPDTQMPLEDGTAVVEPGALRDTVFSLPGKKLPGAVGEAAYKMQEETP